MPNIRLIATPGNETCIVVSRIVLSCRLCGSNQILSAPVVVVGRLGNITSNGVVNFMNCAYQPNDAAVHVVCTQIVVDVLAAQRRHSVRGVIEYFVGQTVVSIRPVTNRSTAPISFCVIDVCFRDARVLLKTQTSVILRPGRCRPFFLDSAGPNLGAGSQSRLPASSREELFVNRAVGHGLLGP